ncbi:MAG: RNA polymerase subunit sigma-70 [Polyangiaceae bacterium]
MSVLTDEKLLELFERHRNELRLHCYRMLGSSHDADDVLQETAVRAWRAKASLDEPANVRAWLYRIATNVCFDELRQRKSRHLPQDVAPPMSESNLTVAPAQPEAWVEPCPAAWFSDVTPDPAARYELQEGVALAFVAALQELTPVQRATLLLRDVVGFSAEETSRALSLKLEAANSALFRARGAVESKLARKQAERSSFTSAAIESVLARYLAAWNQLDVEAFVALLHDDVRTTMPPSPTWIAGRARNDAFYRPMFAAQRPGRFIALPTRANAHGAFAFYRALADGEPHRLRAVQLVELRDNAVVSIDHFMLPELGPAFGLPQELDRAQVDGFGSAPPCIDLAADALREKRRS